MPYLESVAITFVPDKQSEFLLFIQGKLDMIGSVGNPLTLLSVHSLETQLLERQIKAKGAEIEQIALDPGKCNAGVQL